MLEDWWAAIAAGWERGQPLEASPVVLAVVLAGALLVSVPARAWRVFGLFVTYVHELGHALAALLTGRFVRGIRLRLDHSGEMLSHGRGRWGLVWSGFWGYPAPGVAGALYVAAACTGWAGAALSATALLLLAALVFMRNATGVLVAVCCAAAAQAAVLWLPEESVAHVAAAAGIALGVGAVRDWFKVAAVHVRRRDVRSSDAFILARSTGVPAVLWLAGFAVSIGGCTALSAWLLWGSATA